ncbi:MAG TPA: glycosyltransferase [Solirubrobacteraceae bacterium]|nr:glycosyltransferase [Solirubrobacteraceae bacterium]
MIRRALGRALDWRFRAVLGRVDALGERLERLERSLEERLEPMLRAILDEEAQNRRRLYELRADGSYEYAFTDPDPLVSITLATWRRTELLVERALPSLLAQTHANIEVLVVGDAAGEDVGEAVTALGDPRVNYANLTQRIVADPDERRHWLVGSAMARNEATRRASGRWLLHFDEDDHLRPDAVASLLGLARERRAEVAYGGFDAHHPDGSLTRTLAFPPRPTQFGFQGALVHAGLRFFERELVASALDLPGDIYLLERMLRSGVRFAMLERVVWDYYPTYTWVDQRSS